MTFTPLPTDQEFYERELASFVPNRVFDAHAHLWHRRRATEPFVPNQFTHADYLQWIDILHPGRDVAGIFIPIPDKDHLDDMLPASEWVAKEVKHDPRSVGEFFVRPTDDPEWLRQEVRRLGLRGLKCYHITSTTRPTWQADIPTYLPEPIIKVAHEEGWFITLHMVKSRSVADPGNIHWIQHYCKTYPNMKLILAHSARGFQPAHNLEGLSQLKGLDNLYFDSSANCETMAHIAILKILGHKRFMYGSDLFVSHMRGRSLAAADSFIWLYEETPVWGEKHQRLQPALIGHEHLRSLKWACWSLGLSDSQVEDIFWNNAQEMIHR